MQAILNVVLPVFGLILAGYAGGRLGLLGAASSEALNKFVFWFALPTLMFTGFAKIDIAEILSARTYLTLFIASCVGIFGLAMVAGAAAFLQRNVPMTLHAMAASFPNSGYMGVPLCMIAFGEAGLLPALTSTLVNTTVCVGGAVLLIELGSSKGGNPAQVVADAVLAMLKNPIVVAPVLGIAFAAMGWTLPAPVVRFGDLLGATAGPCALFAIGLFMVGKPLAGNGLEVGWVIALKLVAQPILTLGLVTLIPMDPLWTAICVIMSGLPVGGLVFVMAQRYGAWEEQASSTIVLSTLLSIGTLSAMFWYFRVG